MAFPNQCHFDIITVSTSSACPRLTSSLDDLTKFLQAQQPFTRHHNFDSNIQDDAETKQIKLEADNLRWKLLDYRESTHTVAPIIFIASNIGISIVKEALAADLADRTEERGLILRQTRCLIFHDGTRNGRGHRAQVHMPEIVQGCATYYYISTLEDVDTTTPNSFNVGANVTFRLELSVPLNDIDGTDSSVDSKGSDHQVSTPDEAVIIGAASEQTAEDVSRQTTPMPSSAHEPSHSTYNDNVLESLSTSVPAKQPTFRGTGNGVRLWNKLFNVIRAVDRLNPSTKPPSPSVRSVGKSASSQISEGTNGRLSDNQYLLKLSGYYTGPDVLLQRNLSIKGGSVSYSPDQMRKLVAMGSLRSQKKTNLFYTSTSAFREILTRLSLWQYLPCSLRDLAGDRELVLIRYTNREFINSSDRVSALMSIAGTMTLSPLTLAAACGDQQVLRVLLELDISRARDQENGRSALSIAARYGHMRVAETLLAYGVLPDKKVGIARIGPLHQAVICGLPHLSRALVRNGASTNDAQTSLLPDDQRMWLSRMLLMFKPNTTAPQQACTSGRDPNAPAPAKHHRSGQPNKQGAKRLRANEEDEDEAQNNTSKRTDTGGKKDLEAGVEEQYLCPYFVIAPDRHKGCQKQSWVKSKLRRMKGHLKEAHYIFICNSCHLILESEPQLENHVTNHEHAQYISRNYVDGLDSLQLLAVTNTSNIWGRHGQDYWNEVWKILFPDRRDPPLPSPFADVTGRQLDELLRQQRIETVRLERIENGRLEHTRNQHLREQVVNHLRSVLFMTADDIAAVESLFDRHSPQSPELLLEVGALERTQRQNPVPSGTRPRDPAGRTPSLNEDYPQSDGRSDDIPIDPALHSTDTVPNSVSRSPRATMEIYGSNPRREAFDALTDLPIVSSSAFLPPMHTAQGALSTFGTRSSSPGRRGLPQSSNALDSPTMDRSSISSTHPYNGPGSQFDEALYKLSSGEDI